MAMDNPSYFTIPKEDQLFYYKESSNPFIRRGMGTASSVSIQPPPPAQPRSPQHQRTPPSGRHRDSTDSNSSSNAYLIPNEFSQRSDPNKRSFRSLLRSLSASSACSKEAQSILQGEPRPTDIAPANHTVQRPGGRMTHSRNTSLRSCGEFKQNGLRSPGSAGDDGMCHTMPLPGRRRHSIGAYLTRTESTLGRLNGSKTVLKVTSVPSEVPRMDAPRIGALSGTPPAVEGAPPRRRTPGVVTTLHMEPALPISTIAPSKGQRKKRPRPAANKEMEDIMVVWSGGSPEAELWADYLTSCFNKIMSHKARQHYKVVSTSIEELTEAGGDSPLVKQVVCARLQVVIMCPRLLAHVEQLTEGAGHSLRALQVDKVLTMLLGVGRETLTQQHRKVFPSFDKWQCMEVKEQDSTFVDNFLARAVDILSKKYATNNEKASFSIIPKKIKPGQNRVIALLNEPVTNEDVLVVKVDKKGELIKIDSFKKRNPYTLQFDVPDCCLDVSMLVWIKIEKNGVPCGSRQIKCESRLRELDQILRASDNPLEFMCQTLGFKTSDRDQLDSWMLSAFQKNIPPHFNLLSTSCGPNNIKMSSPSMDEYPTLLHFAARFGLEKLCWQLLECPGGEAASDCKNVRHLTPADLAQAHGYSQLATHIRGFMQMNEFSNMYYYLKNMSEDLPEGNPFPNHGKVVNTDPQPPHSWENFTPKHTNKNNMTPVNTPDSLRSDPFSEECLDNLEVKHCPQTILKSPECLKTPTSPKFTHTEWLYENDMQNMNTSFHSVSSQSSVQKAIEHDYLIQPSNIKVEIIKEPPPVRPTQIDLNIMNKSITSLGSPTNEKQVLFQEFFNSKKQFNHFSNKKKLSASNSISSKSSDIMSPSGQDELAEIINDFKNNVFTISEVEKLVLEWRNRNETQQSLKEKQEQLNKMREEYDKLQRRIKESMKRPTPFERVRKIFSKGKSKNGKAVTGDVKSNGQRPNSGLSIHSVSSSSSGRLSTASGRSLGDSGTQSDNEEAKLFGEVTSACKASINRVEDYLVPPSPRPLFPVAPPSAGCGAFNRHQPLPALPTLKQTMDTITERDKEGGSEAQHHHHYMNMSPA